MRVRNFRFLVFVLRRSAAIRQVGLLPTTGIPRGNSQRALFSELQPRQDVSTLMQASACLPLAC